MGWLSCWRLFLSELDCVHLHALCFGFHTSASCIFLPGRVQLVGFHSKADTGRCDSPGAWSETDATLVLWVMLSHFCDGSLSEGESTELYNNNQ